MPKSTSKRLSLSLMTSMVSLMLLFPGCQPHRPQVAEDKPPVPKIETLVVMGFQPALSQWEEPDVVRNPLSGAVFMAEPVPEGAVNKMTTRLFERIVKEKVYNLVSPGQAKGVYSSLVSSDTAVAEIEILKRIGRAFSADAVLSGYLYRWRERTGTDFGVDRAASVAFDLYLTRPADGAILWKGRFDKTQRSLSEDLFDMDTFLRGKGRWMTAESLAEVGLEDVLGKLPGAERAEKD